ncbi:ABC transporter permease [Jannaschia sp. W003]|uniref:ABC transporter permease n=1 Tax=Jannaschia sp. W003 TaxID=2867012 RepID=UPI0021A898F6|nr:sugar ABC transporter permease [Jannaschia sp. W003]UWQ20926.1 sugar ABC transporter permease [Jannaschia sp. W003]
MTRAGWRTALALAPIALVLGGLFGGALVLAVLQSLGFAPWFGVNRFPDAGAYAALAARPGFWASLGLTLWYALFATAISLVLGTALAVLLLRRFPGRRLFGYAYKLPLMVPYGVGIALAVLMMGQGGVLSRLAAAAGLIDDPGAFPALLRTHAGWGIVAVYVWKQLPFVALSVHAVLLGVGRDTVEAAQLLGASPAQTFRLVTLPQIVPGLVGAGTIALAFNLGAFEAPFILGGGYPDTLPVLAWRLFNDADYARQVEGMAAAVVLIALSGALLAAILLAYRAFERRIGRR